MSIIDIVVIAIVIIFLIIGWARGFVKMLVSLLSLVVAFLLASAVVKPIAEPVTNWVYDSFVREKVQDAVNSATSGITLQARPVFVRSAAGPVSQLRTAAATGLEGLSNITGLLKKIPPSTLAKYDPDEMQRLVNFMCSKTCKDRTVNQAVKAYNKKYGTSINIAPILSAIGASGETVIPSIISTTGIKFNIATSLEKVQAANAAAANDAANAAAKAAASKNTSSYSSGGSKTGGSSGKSSKSTSLPSASVPMTDFDLDGLSIFDEDFDLTETVDSFAYSLVSRIVYAVLFVLLFIIIRLLLMILANILTKFISKIPVIGGLNKALGLVLGALCGLVLSAVLTVIVLAPKDIVTNFLPLIDSQNSGTAEKYNKLIDDSVACGIVSKFYDGYDAGELSIGGEDDTDGEDDSWLFED